jgi:hypothetical protein
VSDEHAVPQPVDTPEPAAAGAGAQQPGSGVSPAADIYALLGKDHRRRYRQG